MIFALASFLIIAVLAVTLVVRQKDLPEPEPVSPTAHLEERKKAIYDSLRDLQFEYRMGKLSDQDYAESKLDLQRQLAVVLAEMEKIEGKAGRATPRAAEGARAGLEHGVAERGEAGGDTAGARTGADAAGTAGGAAGRGAADAGAHGGVAEGGAAGGDTARRTAAGADGVAAGGGATPDGAKPPAVCVCPQCAAEFAQPMKFCGECGAPMAVTS